MSFKTLIFNVFTLLTIVNATAQNASIKGTVIDESTGDKIPFANILVKETTKSNTKGTATDINGQFNLSGLELGEYTLVLSFIGYESDTLKNIKLTKAKNSINLDKIGLKVSRIALKELNVNAQIQTQKTSLDRKTYKASEFETAKGGTAVDLLNKLPSVAVSAAGEISVRGTTDFMVYLNGKPTQMDPSMLLGQIASDAIENIEIIAVPSAKYDAQGKGGIINISTKTSTQNGLVVGINGTIGGAPWNNTKDAYSNYVLSDDRSNAGVNLMYSKKNFTFYSGFNYSLKNVNGDRTGDARIYDKNTGLYKHMIAENGERPEWYENLGANAGFDLKLSDKSILSASYFYGDRTEGRSAFYIYNIFTAEKDKTNKVGEKWVYNPNTDNRYGTFHSANVDFKTKFKNKSELALSALYEHSNLWRELKNENYGFDPLTNKIGNKTLHFKQDDKTPLDAVRFSIDYSKEFDNKDKLSFGVQPQFINIDGDFKYDTLRLSNNQFYPNTELENGFDLTRNVYSAYVDYMGGWKKLKYLVGLRFEYTDQKMTIENPDFFSIFDNQTKSNYKVQQPDWFPTLHLSYDLNEKNKLTFAANRRISRPAVKDMAPFLYRRHLEVYVVGDPTIKPQYISNVELNYETWIGKQKIGLTGFYRAVDNALFRVNTVYDKELVLIRSVTNSGNTASTGIELNANIDAGKRTKLFVGGSVYHFHVEGEAFGYKENNNSVNWSLKGNANYNITNEIKLSADFDLKSATVTAQGNNFMMYLANVALNYNPSKLKNWNFSLKALDILNSNTEGLDTRAFDSSKKEVFYQKTYYYRTGSIAELSINYQFNQNKAKIKAKSDSTFGKSEF